MEPKEGAGDVGGDAGHGEAPSDAAKQEPGAAEAQKEATAHAAEAKAEADDEHKAAQDKADKAEQEADEKPRPARPLPLPPPQDGSFATTAGVIALVILLGGVLLSVFVMRRSDAEKKQATPDKKAHNKRGDHKKEAPAPWQIGQKVPVNITVIPDDVDILECGSPTEITGKHCAYESKETLWSKADGGDPKDDKALLRPYSTTARQKLLGAGMWSQLKQPLPTKRFVVKCTFDVEAKIQKPLVRFAKGKEFHEVKDGWFAGALTGCSVVPPKN